MDNIKILNENKFDEVYYIMKKSFPETERRTYEGQKNLLSNKSYKLYVYELENKIVAFISLWEFSNILFIEHFAVSEELRGKRIGNKILCQVLKATNKRIVLEAELPTDEISNRRIKFYEKVGFYLNEFEYYQPKLQEGSTIIPLKIMSYPKRLLKEEFIETKKLLYNYVYKVGE